MNKRLWKLAHPSEFFRGTHATVYLSKEFMHYVPNMELEYRYCLEYTLSNAQFGVLTFNVLCMDNQRNVLQVENELFLYVSLTLSLVSLL